MGSIGARNIFSAISVVGSEFDALDGEAFAFIQVLVGCSSHRTHGTHLARRNFSLRSRGTMTPTISARATVRPQRANEGGEVCLEASQGQKIGSQELDMHEMERIHAGHLLNPGREMRVETQESREEPSKPAYCHIKRMKLPPQNSTTPKIVGTAV
uniref:Uncharacterized protein n=1 Tax=Oryza brachyantha TaxID=4533 RepID=J3MKM8_ORYBR